MFKYHQGCLGLQRSDDWFTWFCKFLASTGFYLLHYFIEGPQRFSGPKGGSEAKKKIVEDHWSKTWYTYIWPQRHKRNEKAKRCQGNIQRFPIVSGFLGAAWSLAWWVLSYEKPATHPSISEEERSYIEASIGEGSTSSVKVSCFFSNWMTAMN